MKKLLSAVLAVTFMLGVALVVYAEETTVVKGEVVSIDPAGKTIVINTVEGQKTVIFQETTTGFKEVKPGMSVEMTCIDQEGKSCAKDIKIISAAEAGKPTRTVEGEVVSIDPAGKTVVIKSKKGELVTVTLTQPGAPMVEKVVTRESAPAGEKITVEPMPMTEIKPGAMVKADCFDSGGKFCANTVTVISAEQAAKQVEVEGPVVSIDPAGQAVVVKTAEGEKTLYYQKVTTGAPMSDIEVGKSVKAYCLDIEGKTCIRDITVVK